MLARIAGLFLGLAFIISFAANADFARNEARTKCTWENFRDGMHFESVSSFETINHICDCVGALGTTTLVIEPIRGLRTYDGTFYLKDLNDNVISKCESRTIKPISDADRNKLMGVLFSRPNSSGDESVDLEFFRSKYIQSLLQKHMIVECDAPTS